MSAPAPSMAAVVQMTSTADTKANMATMRRLVRVAKHRGARIVVVPECFSYLGPGDGKLRVAESLSEDGPILRECTEVAVENGVDVVFGGFWERCDDSRVFNTCLHIDATGTVRAAYRKIHLFDVSLSDGTTHNESATVCAGVDAVTTEAPFGTLGLSICYDIRFPVLYQRLVDAGAIAMAVPAAFTYTTGTDHWHTLLRARAIETQSYVLAAAQSGTHFVRRRSFGHAMIIDPWGKVLDEVCSDEGEGVALANIDAKRVHDVRGSLPSLAHRVVIRSA